MKFIQVQINKLPLVLCCFSDGSIAIHRMCNFSTIIDQPEEGVQAIISNEDIYIGAETEIEYGERYYYKEVPELLAWLVAQNMEMPV